MRIRTKYIQFCDSCNWEAITTREDTAVTVADIHMFTHPNHQVFQDTDNGKAY